MKKYLRHLFIIFLFAYLLFIGLHLFKINWNLQTFLLFFSGGALALLAHARKNYITVAILILHMCIEWFEWSEEKLTMYQIIFNCLHATMDFVFLSHELKVHVKQYRKTILITLFVMLIAIFVFGHNIPIEIGSLEKLEPIVIGGVLGCILSHIYFHIKKE